MTCEQFMNTEDFFVSWPTDDDRVERNWVWWVV